MFYPYFLSNVGATPCGRPNHGDESPTTSRVIFKAVIMNYVYPQRQK